MTTVAPPPRNAFRRFERWMIGAIMGIGAFFIEKLVLRSIRKEGGKLPTKEPDVTPLQGKGSEISG
jgi:hypothetical protein